MVALIEPGADKGNLEGLGVEEVPGDVRDFAAVRKALEGCRTAFHVAAFYRFWARDKRQFYSVNVEGTRNVLVAARQAGTERIVYTSTVGTLSTSDHAGSSADETSFPDIAHLFGAYKRSKYVAEHEVLRAAAEGLPVSLVLPTFPLGPGDRGPTPTGKVVLDFLNGRLPGYVDTVLNVVHVDDVAAGHLLAMERGEIGRSYILGGENMEMRMLLEHLGSQTGLRVPALKVPRAVALSVAGLSEAVEGNLLRRHPAVPLEAARMSTTRMAFDDSRARAELGYISRPAADAIRDSVSWFRESGYVTRRSRHGRLGRRHQAVPAGS